MIKKTILSLFLFAAAQPVAAACSGVNLIEEMPDADREALFDTVAEIPNAKGNFWRVTREGETAVLVGTYHLDDTRHNAVFDLLAPQIDAAATVLVEAGPEEQEQLKSEMARRPDRLFLVTGPTLPEQLEEADWQALSGAMQARGFPAFLASKMQPWYISMMLGIPPCAMADFQDGANGLDARIISYAKENDVPIRALEPYDTVFNLFDSMGREAQLEMIRTTLAMVDRVEDYSTTLADSYFSEDVRLTWELGRLAAYEVPGATRDEVDASLENMEEALMNRRNRAWIPVIKDAMRQGPVFIAFGALHLSGEDGVLSLLEREGYTLERITF